MGNLDLERRLFLATAAALAAGGARASQAAGAQLDFASIGGSPRNAGPRNRQLFVDAVSRLHAAGGGTLIVPAGVYPFAGEAVVLASNVAVVARGATFRGSNCRITIRDGSTGFGIDGLTLIDTSGSSAGYLLNCAGSRCYFRNVHLEKSPVAGGYIAYCRQNTVGNRFENFSFSGSNGIYLGGSGHRVAGGWAQSSGHDDCWVIKSFTHASHDIEIRGFRAKGFTAVLSIGSEVGRRRDVKAFGPIGVRGVLLEDCVAEGCTYLAYIKPGGVGAGNPAYDWQDGLVEDVTIRHCRCEDATGAAFRNAVYVAPGRGSIVRRVRIENLEVRARAKAPAVQDTSAVYLRVLSMTNRSGSGGKIEDVVVDGVRCIDPYQGAPQGQGRPGLPLTNFIVLQRERAGRGPVGRIGRVLVRGMVGDGCSRNAVTVSDGVGPVRLENCQFRNFAAAPVTALHALPVLARSPVAARNVIALPSPLAPPGTRTIRVGAAEVIL